MPYRGRVQGKRLCVDVRIMASGPRVLALKAAGLPVPMPSTGLALIDTGASCSAIDLLVIRELGLQATGNCFVATPSTGLTPVTYDTYDVSIGFELKGIARRGFTVGAIGTHLTPSGILVLIGWDILDHCHLVVDGPGKSFELDIP